MADNNDIRKCANNNCTCVVTGDHRYCCDDCETAADTNPTAICTCDHPGCRSN